MTFNYSNYNTKKQRKRGVTMAFDSKKDYWWMALHENFFDMEELAYIEDEMPNGNLYILFFLKLCLMSLKNRGLIGRVVADMFLPYSEVTLAKETKLEAKEIKNALTVLSRAKLIEITEGVIYIPMVDSMVGTKKAGHRKIESEKRQARRLSAIQAQIQLLNSGKTGQMSGHLSGHLSGQQSDTTKNLKLKTENSKTDTSKDVSINTTTVVEAAVVPEEPVDNSDLLAKIEKLKTSGIRTSVEYLASIYSDAELDSYIAWAQAAAKKSNYADFLYKALEGCWQPPQEYQPKITCPRCNGKQLENYSLADGIETTGLCSLCKGKGFVRKENKNEN